ncbi:MAG: putative peptidoglycan glycosyltransferase FtsW [bacterium]|nr:putative peptidoglycan glycosyltransferase FtsW [bacterium]
MARPTVVFPWIVVGLVLFGLVMVGNASVVDAARDFGDQWYFLKLQTGWAGIGLVGLWLTSRFPYQNWARFAKIGFVVSGLLLVAVLIPGLSIRILGARRWLDLGLFSFQPAELAKLTLVLYWAKLLDTKKDMFWPFIISLLGTAALVMLEPDLGTTLVLVGTGLVVYFASGGKMKYLALVTPLIILAGLGLILLSPYRRSRLMTYFDYSRDPLGSSYHIRQVLLSLGSGGPWGVGLGQSRQKYEFLPEVSTDSIFAVVGEELGLVGTTALILAFAAFFFWGMKIAKRVDDQFGANLAIGLVGWISLQALLNMAAMVALVPLTGIPLPFISYGGSSLVIALVSCGILINISRQN